MSVAFFEIVGRDVARNPVARAVANAKIRDALRTFAVQMYGLPDGSQQAENLMASAQVLAVGMQAAGPDSPEWAAMQDAQDRILARSGDGFRWLTADAAEIDIGIHAAVQVLSKRSAEAVRAAWLFVNREAA